MDDKIYQETAVESLSVSQLMWRQFKKHKLAIGASILLIIFYFVAATAGFFSVSNPNQRNASYIFAPPQLPRFFDEEGNFQIRPFVYDMEQKMDPVSFRRTYDFNQEKKLPVYFFIRGDSYKILGLLEANLKLFGLKDEESLYLLGADERGRDVFSRIIYGARISLTIGLVGVFFSLFIGMILGGISGLYGGIADMVVQRGIEIIRSIPQIPLWMGLAAALPDRWSIVKVYFAITIILSLVGWTTVARVVRGKFLSLRDEDFVSAARSFGCSEPWIIFRHLIPNFLSYLLVQVTLSIPGMIIGETALSFLGIGLRPPAVSWGVLLQQAQSTRTVVLHPWLFLPGFAVIIAVLCFNFVGDGLRDAADPHK